MLYNRRYNDDWRSQAWRRTRKHVMDARKNCGHWIESFCLAVKVSNVVVEREEMNLVRHSTHLYIPKMHDCRSNTTRRPVTSGRNPLMGQRERCYCVMSPQCAMASITWPLAPVRASALSLGGATHQRRCITWPTDTLW